MNAPKLRFKSDNGKRYPEWIPRPLKEVCKKIKDGTHFSPKSKSGPRKYITSKNIRNGGLDLSNCSYISDDEHREIYRRCPVEPGDILLTKDGAGTGNCCANTLTEEFSLLSSVAVLSGEEGVLSNEFLLQMLQSELGQNAISNVIAGQAITRITLDKINKFTFMIPHYEEQEKISSFLSAVDQKMLLLTKKHELLLKYKKGVMQKIFSQEIRFKGKDGKEFLEWETRRLEEITCCLDNRRRPVNESQRAGMVGEIPYWGANNIMGYVNDYLFDETIVLLAEDGGNFNEFATRPIANLSKGKCWVNNHAHVLVGNKLCLTEYLYYSLVHKDITAYVSGGTRAKLTKGEMLKIPVITPSIDEQNLIVNFLGSLDKKITAVTLQLNLVKQYKQGLLEQMFI